MVLWVLLAFLVPGLAYGAATGSVRNDHDVARLTGDTLATMGSYIVLAFVAARTGTARSAAAVGVGARQSDA